MRRRKSSVPLNIFAVLIAALALFSGIWIVLPAPTAALWVFSVAATEGSLAIGALGICAMILGGASFRRRPGAAGAFAMIAGLISLLLAQLPFLEALPVAQHFGVGLSLGEYLNLTPADHGDAPVSVTTVSYGARDGKPLDADIYRLTSVAIATPQPAIVVIHGGSWRGGHRSDFARWDRFLSAQGYTVFDIDYTLAPQPNWQSAPADVAAAVRYIRDHAGQFGVEPGEIALLGRSAGGHLALLAAYRDVRPPVQATVSFYGPTDLIWGYDHVANPDVIDGRGVLRAFLGGTPDQKADAYRDASPITYAGSRQPPTLLIHGGRDRLVGPQHAVRLEDRLTADGNTVEFVPIPYALHGFDADFDGWGSQIARPVLLRFLHDHLHKRQ